MGITVTSGQKDSQENYNLPHDVDCYYVDTALKGSAIEWTFYTCFCSFCWTYEKKSETERYQAPFVNPQWIKKTYFLRGFKCLCSFVHKERNPWRSSWRLKKSTKAKSAFEIPLLLKECSCVIRHHLRFQILHYHLWLLLWGSGFEQSTWTCHLLLWTVWPLLDSS